MLASGSYQHTSSKKEIQLVLAPNLSNSTRMSLLSSRSTLSSLKREEILLDPVTGKEMADHFGYIKGMVKMLNRKLPRTKGENWNVSIIPI